jgi:hypothetical protein
MAGVRADSAPAWSCTWDHFFPLVGDPHGKHIESLTTQAAMVEVTRRAQIGALVMCNS